MGCSGPIDNSHYEDLTITIEDIKEDKIIISLVGILRQEEIFKLCNKKFKKLKQLNLSQNDLTNISELKDLKAPKLQILDLSHNLITIITDGNNSSKYYDFPQLEELNLSNNKLININGLKSFKTPKLKKIDLSHNLITIITDNNNSPKYYDFPQLEELNLSNNSLMNICELKSFKAPNLKILDISFNNFKDFYLAPNIESFKLNFDDFPKLDNFNNLFYTEKFVEIENRAESNNKINNKIIEDQINNPIVSSYKLSSNE